MYIYICVFVCGWISEIRIIPFYGKLEQREHYNNKSSAHCKYKMHMCYDKM